MKVIYAISPTSVGPTKVGIAASLEKRLDQLQVGCWEPLRVGYFGAFYIPSGRGALLGLGDIFASSEKAAASLELATHKRLKKMGHHIRGEWFDTGFSTVANVIEDLVSRSGMKPVTGKPLQDYIDMYGPRSSGNRSSYRELKAFIRSVEFGKISMAKEANRRAA